MTMNSNYKTMRFGMLAIEKGFATAAQVGDALETQIRENIQSGIHRPIGEILKANALINDSQIDKILEILLGDGANCQ